MKNKALQECQGPVLQPQRVINYSEELKRPYAVHESVMIELQQREGDVLQREGGCWVA